MNKLLDFIFWGYIVCDIKNIQQIQEKILTRYEQNGRDLPWRHTQDPYAIHISEVMSQQTQVDRVIPYRKKWMKDIPDYQALARLPKSELFAYWSGLGFNSRALRLQECARVVVDCYSWDLPREKSELLALPWIGPYTAGAICAFAYNQEEVVIDTNIRRVLIFLLNLDEETPIKELEHIAQQMIPYWRSRDWHNALMDYGAVHLTARKTKIKSLGKQSKFEGSDRQVRGWILKQLTKGEIKSLTFDCVCAEFPQKDVGQIVEGMVKDWLVRVYGEKIVIE